MSGEYIDRTLVLLKPDAVQRGIMGELISRFERVGMKVIACKLSSIDAEFAKKHYFDVAERRGEQVLKMLVDFMTSGPILAMCLEGIDVAENARRLVGETEPKSASPGTIRGDYAHCSFRHSDSTGQAIQNLVHASANAEEAAVELSIWFQDSDYINYTAASEKYTLG